MMSIIRTEPRSRVRALNNSSSPARTVRCQFLAHHLDPFLDLSRIGAGAVSAEHELDYIGRDRELAAEPADQVFADHMAGKCFSHLPVEVVQLDQFRFSLR
jgi:hypothetical protein